MSIKFSIRGGSNAIMIHKSDQHRPTSKKWKIANHAKGGATVDIHSENCVCYQGPRIPAKPFEEFIFFATMNSYEHSFKGLDKFLKDYVVALRKFVKDKCTRKHKIHLLLPLPRAKNSADFGHIEQMRRVRAWGSAVEDDGFRVYFTYAYLPKELRKPENLFSKKDKNGIHFSFSVRERIFAVIRKIVESRNAEAEMFTNDHILNIE